MTGVLNSLQNLREIPTCPVGLPNGKKILATQEEKTELDENLVLNDVLYVP